MCRAGFCFGDRTQDVLSGASSTSATTAAKALSKMSLSSGSSPFLRSCRSRRLPTARMMASSRLPSASVRLANGCKSALLMAAISTIFNVCCHLSPKKRSMCTCMKQSGPPALSTSTKTSFSSPAFRFIYTRGRKSGHPALSTCTQISFSYIEHNTQNYVHVHENPTIWISPALPSPLIPFPQPNKLFSIKYGHPKSVYTFGWANPQVCRLLSVFGGFWGCRLNPPNLEFGELNLAPQGRGGKSI